MKDEILEMVCGAKGKDIRCQSTRLIARPTLIFKINGPNVEVTRNGIVHTAAKGIDLVTVVVVGLLVVIGLEEADPQ